MSVHSDFWDLFSMATTWQPLIYANQNAPKPPTPFALMQLTATNPTPPHYSSVDDQGYRDITETHALQAQVQFFGEGCWGEAATFALRMKSVDVLAKAEALNIGINSLNQIQDIPALVESSFYEPRTVFDMDVSYAFTIQEFTSFIETVYNTLVVPNRPDQHFIATVQY